MKGNVLSLNNRAHVANSETAKSIKDASILERAIAKDKKILQSTSIKLLLAITLRINV